LSKKIGALWRRNSQNPKAPEFSGSLQVKDIDIARQIADLLIKGEPVKVSAFKDKGTQDGKKYPDLSIVLDTYKKQEKPVVDTTFVDDIPF